MIYKNSVLTSKETNFFFPSKKNRLILFGKITDVRSENHTKHANTQYRENAEFLNVPGSGRYN
jgi:hypothetical protein